MAKNKIIESRQVAEKQTLLETLKKNPIIQFACEKAGVSRATFYRWRKEDKDFAKTCDEAINEGVELVSDLAESKLINAIKEQNFNAISFWLRHRHQAYAEKLLLQGKIETNVSLTPEQEDLVRRALNFVTREKVTDQYGKPATKENSNE